MDYKFRGKIYIPDKPCSEWTYGIYVSSTDRDYIIDSQNNQIDIVKDTVGMWTGLRDHSCAEIYDGDILIQCSGIRKKNHQDRYVVVWNDKQAGFKLRKLDEEGKETFISESKVKTLKICGNIYDTKLTI